MLTRGCETNPMPPDAEKVFSGLLFDVWQWEQELYDGSFATFERISRSDTVHTVGVLPDNQLLLTRDRQPDRGPVLTPPGGMLEEGESPETGAKREFLEETGYKIGNLMPWHKYRASSKIEWMVHAFIGRDLKKVAEPKLDAGEKIDPVTYTFDEFLQLGHDVSLRDKEIRIILLEALLDDNKKQALYNLFYSEE